MEKWEKIKEASGEGNPKEYLEKMYENLIKMKASITQQIAEKQELIKNLDARVEEALKNKEKMDEIKNNFFK